MSSCSQNYVLLFVIVLGLLMILCRLMTLSWTHLPSQNNAPKTKSQEKVKIYPQLKQKQQRKTISKTKNPHIETQLKHSIQSPYFCDIVYSTNYISTILNTIKKQLSQKPQPYNQNLNKIIVIGHQMLQKYTTQKSISKSLTLVSSNSNKNYVMKKVNFSTFNEKEKQNLIDEVNTLSTVKSSNIVRYYDYSVDKATMCLYVVMEFCHQGALQQLLEMRREANAILEQSAIWNIFWQVVVAVHEIHNDKKGVLVHRNIKPESILLGADDCVKLGNFGVAKRLESEDHYAQTNIQGGRYTSPEQLTQGIFTTQTDIWALGCLLYQITTLKVPFASENEFERGQMIKKGVLQPIPSTYSKELQRVINWCLDKNYQRRPTAKDLTSIPEINQRIRSHRLLSNKKSYQRKKKELMEKQQKIKQMEQQIRILQLSMQV